MLKLKYKEIKKSLTNKESLKLFANYL